MSDYCGRCAFSPKTTCPLTPLYWAFLERHKEVLDDNDRMKLVMASARRRSEAQKQADAKLYAITRKTLSSGSTLTPATLPSSSEPFSLTSPTTTPKKTTASKKKN